MDPGPGVPPGQSETVLQGASPRLPSPPEIAALLQTHLHNIQQQQFMPHPPMFSNQSEHSFSQPNSMLSNDHRQLDISQQSASLPPNFSDARHKHNVQTVNQALAQPSLFKSTNQSRQYSNVNPMDSSVHSESTNPKTSFERQENRAFVEMPRAVPIKPPHQCGDSYMADDQHSVVSGNFFFSLYV